MSDLISRQAAIDVICEHGTYLERRGITVLAVANHKQVTVDLLEALPSADRPHGEWKRRLVDNGFNADWVCSECGYRVKMDFVSFNFCPNCGARMKGADDE